MPSALNKVGFIGLGAMGRGMSANLLRAGYELWVWDISEVACHDLARQGAHVAASSAEMASVVDVVFSMVPDAPDVRAVALGPDGIIEGAHDRLIYADFSTIDPTTSREVAAALAKKNVRMLDSPVGRGVPEAIAGTVTFMIGGEAATLEEVRPHLEAMSSEILHIGGQGAGTAVKLVNNYLASGFVAVIAEAVALGTLSGLTIEKIISLSDKTGTSNKVLNMVLPSKAFLGDYSPGFASRLAAKDHRLTMKLGRDLGVTLAVGETVMKILSDCEALHPNDDFMGTIMRAVEDQSGACLRMTTVPETASGDAVG